MDQDTFSIGEAAKASGLSVKAIRYYEEIGLIPRATRRNGAARTGGHRLYARSDVRRLRFIRHGRLLGLSLDEVGKLLEVANGDCPGVQPAYRNKLASHLIEIDERIEQLLGLKASIEEILRSKPGSMRGRCCMGSQASGANIGSELASSGEPAR